MEELARCGARVFIRVGTCGTFLDSVHNGDMVIFDAAMRLDGASRLYAPIEYPAVASHDVVEAAIQAAKGLRLPHHVGITRSADTFYAGHTEPGSSYNGYWQSWWKDHFDDLARLNIPAAEMEASVIFVLARVWGLRAGGMAVVGDNVRRVSGSSGEFVPEKQIKHGPEEIERLARLGCETVRLLALQDQKTAQPV